MEIEATRMTAMQTPTESPPPLVAPADIEAFTQALFGHTAKTPEAFALTNLQDKSQALDSSIANARESVLDSPLKMLSAQSNMLHSIVEVDLIAKTAGALAQGVNKLVSMQ
ncbi:type III secretion system inner rod subunit SctI [Pseudomonas sp. SWRI79]|uniref:Type III secretion system inner rod subunit SctI n=1 Tax=Pseudomonas farris TaxID=2841207 RepID=A0ABS6Q0L7_9PSED|nr:type III secretion system inner rod subunit SctI [Pseudomonas farris]MBV4465821.1 type III secretion system inner rod subunit SctI [Pseudomonas farris]